MSQIDGALPYDETTVVTEAIENVTYEAVTGAESISNHLQRAISIASNAGVGSATPGAFVVESSRLAVALVRALASNWTAMGDGIALIASDEVADWWTTDLRSLLDPAAARPAGTLRATVHQIPSGQATGPAVTLVSFGSTVAPASRGVPVTAGLTQEVRVCVRQAGDFRPGAVRITLRIENAAPGAASVDFQPIDAVLSH